MNLQPLCTLDVIESNTGEIDDNESSSYLYYTESAMATEKLWDQFYNCTKHEKIVKLDDCRTGLNSPTILPAQSLTLLYSYNVLCLLTCSDKLASYMKQSFHAGGMVM